ncbi:MAG TPA: LytR C-terminal domain-containing protein [Gemmatimonadaceae bacterium]|nr:LytR C-terminal domain-containing protein [Gemmatimonadaceae bacterium]
MSRARTVSVVLIILIALGAGVAAAAFRRRPVVPGKGVAVLRLPDSARIRVQVINSTKTRGLARHAAMLLRDNGFDVVETGTIKQTRDTTLVLDLSGHPEWAKRVAALFSVARIEARRDSSRYLDIAVVLGSTWRPPPGPLNP